MSVERLGYYDDDYDDEDEEHYEGYPQEVEPYGYHTPMFPGLGTRPVFFDEGLDRTVHHFSPHEINPASDGLSRPHPDWQRGNVPTDPTLDLDSAASTAPGGPHFDRMNLPADRHPVPLYRGINIDLSEPSLHRLRRLLHGPNKEDLIPGQSMARDDQFWDGKNPERRDEIPWQPYFDEMPTNAEAVGESGRWRGSGDPRSAEITQIILDHINSKGGVGTHWTTDYDQAVQFARFGGNGGLYKLPIIMHHDWMGVGEDPYRRDTDGEWTDEQEITHLPGAPINLSSMEIWHDPYATKGAQGALTKPKWHTVYDTWGEDESGPRRLQAALDDEEEEEDEGNYCSKCGPGDSDWCESCEQCSYCDSSHENHCPSCGPNDSDWCEDCGQCNHCDWDHQPHCGYCGKDEYGETWCSDCEHCKDCDGPCYHQEVNNFPASYDTPLYPARMRPEIYNNDSHEHQQYFAPHEINPASQAESRPWINWEKNDEEDPTLDLERLPPHVSNGREYLPVNRKPFELYRALDINVRHPDLAPLRRALFGKDFESHYQGSSIDPGDPANASSTEWIPGRGVYQPGMFGGPSSDKELAAGPVDPDKLHPYLPLILHHIENFRHNIGIGRHWSTDQSVGDGFVSKMHPRKTTWMNPFREMRIPVRMTAHWMGQGEDPYRTNTGEEYEGQFTDEQELTIRPGAKMTLGNVEIWHPNTNRWHSILDMPVQRLASTTDSATDNYLQRRKERGEEDEITHGFTQHFPSWAQRHWLERQDQIQRKLMWGRRQ